EREAAQRKRRQVRVVEREDDQDRDRRVEEHHDQREEAAQQPGAVPRERDVRHSTAACRGTRKRANATVSTITTPSRKTASTEPVSQSGKPCTKRSWIWFPYMYPDEPPAPPTSEGVTNSPSVGMNTNRKAAKTPGRLSGSVTRRNACSRLAPRSLA